ncbi:MAG TPA: response regulator [Dehalococcoidia bacterium]|nr:response regulator [Dehalococcoidia bacterium]
MKNRLENQTSKAKVLIVDDEATVREVLTRKLTGHGYHCTTAFDGNDALKKLKNNQIDLVLLDISMPQKSGVEVLKEIRDKWIDTAVIMVTAIADVETAINAMKLGAYDYVIKPIDLDVLLISIDRALEKRRLLLENRAYQLYLEQKVKEQTDRIRQSFMNSITALATALEAKDAYTKGHSERVTRIAVAIAEELGFSHEQIDKIRLAGLVHDIGKIGISESILNKPGKLTNEEFEFVKAHCELGQRILHPIVQDNEILDMVLHHHERYDGRGYPHGLSAQQISLGARILAIADAYDAMTSCRPYRPALSLEAVCAELEKGKGTQLDPAIVDILLKVISKRRKL